MASPAPDHRDGLAANDFIERASFLALWYAAAEVGSGRDGVNLLTSLETPLHLGDDMALVAQMLLEGAAIGARTSQSALAHRLATVQEPLRRLVQAVAAARPPGERRSGAEQLERRLLERLPLGGSLALNRCARACVDLTRLGPIDLHEGVDVLQLDFVAGGELAARHEMPVLGGVSTRDVAETAFSLLGEQEFRRRTNLVRGPLYWARLGWRMVAEAASNVRAVRRGQRAARRVLKGVRGRALLSAALAGYRGPPSRHASRLAEQLAPLDETPPDTPLATTSLVTTSVKAAAWTGRSAYWEGVFVEPDPWNYGSVYEQTKYDQTLDLIGAAPVANALELACAEGRFTAQLAGRAERLIAADISTNALARAAGRCAGLANVEFRRIDLVSDSLPAGQTLIVCSEVLYYVDGLGQLPQVIAKLRDALAPGGRLIMAHYFLLKDDRTATGFDWDQAYGARVIHEVAAATAGLRLAAATITELYRIDCFERPIEGWIAPPPQIQRAEHGEPLDLPVERAVVWAGAKALRRELIQTRTTWTVPVLMYHRVSDKGPAALDRWRVSPETFREQMRRLRSLGCHAVTSQDLIRHRNRGEPLPGRPVLISFDDGYADFARHAWPILQRCDLTAEVFVVTDHVGAAAQWDAAAGPPAKLMNWSVLRRISAEGVHFGSHMAGHARARELSTDTLLAEAVRSRAILQQELQTPIRSIAAPYGDIDDRFLWAVEKAGYRINFTTDEGAADIRGHPYRMPRIEVWGHWSPDDLERAIERAERGTAAEASAVCPAGPLVSVIIPAYNAESSIEETLQSVRGQTHQALEIIVVDDGSHDGTAAIVQRHAAEDARVRLITQANAGVAAARNRGVAEARAELIAPVDADDLWAPTKIEKQLSVLDAGGERMGLVYTWYATIDGQSRVTDLSHTPSFEGQVLRHICLGNFVGNGSSPLMRKCAILECGGYEPALRDQKAQGCEDLLLYFRIAERYDFGLTPEHLTGYRQLPAAMSGDVFQMLRSFRLAAQEMRARHPQYAGEIHSGEAHLASWLFWKARRAGKHRDAGRLAWLALRKDPLVGLSLARALALGLFRRLARRGASREAATRFSIAAAPVSEPAL